MSRIETPKTVREARAFLESALLQEKMRNMSSGALDELKIRIARLERSLAKLPADTEMELPNYPLKKEVEGVMYFFKDGH